MIEWRLLLVDDLQTNERKSWDKLAQCARYQIREINTIQTYKNVVFGHLCSACLQWVSVYASLSNWGVKTETSSLFALTDMRPGSCALASPGRLKYCVSIRPNIWLVSCYLWGSAWTTRTKSNECSFPFVFVFVNKGRALFGCSLCKNLIGWGIERAFTRLMWTLP